MKYLAKNGLSMSQAQSVSNIINQKATEINNEISKYNNYSETIKVDEKDYTLIKGVRIDSEETIEKILTLGKLRSAQAFLMEAIKEKDRLLEENQYRSFMPERLPERPKEIPQPEYLSKVNEEWAWNSLTENERSEYLNCEAMAAHIGQFIHKNGKLDTLRRELPHVPAISWMEVEDGKKTPVMINVHHNSEDLLSLYEELAALHRKYESRVNYYKARVKNMTNIENSRIASENILMEEKRNKKVAELYEEYNALYKEVSNRNDVNASIFQKDKLEKEKEIAALRIKVNPLFSEIIDEILKEITFE